MKIRPEGFWETFDFNASMLERGLRKLKEGTEIVGVAGALIQPIRDGEVMAIEFLPPLVEFCQELVEWFDVSRLSSLHSTSIVSLRKLIKTVKTALQRFKRQIVEQNYVDHDPLEFYQIHLSLIAKCYSDFMAKLAVHVRSTTGSTAQSSSEGVPVQNADGKRRRDEMLSSDEDDIKVQQFLTGAGKEMSEEDEIDTSEDERARAAPQTEGMSAADEIERKPDINQLMNHPSFPPPHRDHPRDGAGPSALPDIPTELIPRHSANQEDNRRTETPAVDSSRKHSYRLAPSKAEWQQLALEGGQGEIPEPIQLDIDPPASQTPIQPHYPVSPGHMPHINSGGELGHDETFRSSIQPRVKVEHEGQEDLEESADQRKQAVIDSHSLDSEILCDLWISHHVVKLFPPFKFPHKKQDFTFGLEDLTHIRFPRLGFVRGQNSQEHKALPMELVLLVDIQADDQEFTQVQNITFLINGKPLVVQNTQQNDSSIKLVIPFHPDGLKKGSNLLRIKDSKRMRWEATMSIEQVTMMSEREMFEKGIKMTCTNERTVKLAESNQGPASLLDPISQTLINCPVRGSECNHLRCFDLQKFLHKNRFASIWTCPIESCKRSCKPLELEFDDWTLRNIQEIKNVNDQHQI